jgi:hypothetical protein
MTAVCIGTLCYSLITAVQCGRAWRDTNILLIDMACGISPGPFALLTQLSFEYARVAQNAAAASNRSSGVGSSSDGGAHVESVEGEGFDHMALMLTHLQLRLGPHTVSMMLQLIGSFQMVRD